MDDPACSWRHRRWPTALIGGLALLIAAVTVGRADDDPNSKTPDAKRVRAELAQALAADDEEKIAYWTEILGYDATPLVLKQVIEIGLRYPSDPVAGIVRRVLGGAKGTDSVRFFAEELGKAKDKRRALLIIEALGTISGEGTVEPLADALGRAADPAISLEIVKALREKPDPRAVDALIRLFGKIESSQDKLWAELRVSLLKLTGETYTEYEDWVNWWNVNRDTWKPSTTSKEEALTHVYRPKGGTSIELPEIFGHEIASKRVIFVIDTSSSMLEPFRPDETESGATGTGPTRLEAAKEELIKAVLTLRPDVRFGLIAYNKRVFAFSEKKLLAANDRNKRKAIEFIKSWKPDSTTNTGEAMLSALEVPDVDTIVLLSDGSPTNPETGKLVPVDPIIDAIFASNRFKKVTIHTLGFDGAKVSFMRALADGSGGTYAPIR